jgi:uncharacterized protein (TIGR03437 family)
MWDLSVPLSTPSLAPTVTAFSTSTLTVTGTNFTQNSIVRWNGVDRGATFVSPTSLRAVIPDGEVGAAGRASIVVFNPSAGGGLSNTLNVDTGGAPEVTVAGITSVAVPGSPLVPGSVAAVYGRNLAGKPVQAGSAATPLPYTLGGVLIELNGVPAPLFFVSPNQINFQVPWDLQGHSRATFQLYNGTQASAPLTVNLAFAAPAIFTTSGAGTGQAAALISGTGSLAAPSGAFPNSRPAKRGEVIEIYCTGLGPVSNTQTNGAPKPNSRPADTAVPVVTIGSQQGAVLFSGLTVGAVGLYQVNVQVPANAPVGDAVPVTMTVTGAASNTVTIAVQ